MYALEIHGLKKIYKNGVEALKGIDLNVKQGDFFALLGANGAGKSTTIGLITHLLSKTSGSIKIEGYDLDKNPEWAKSSIGLVPQEFNLNIFESCEQILLNQAGYYGLCRKKAKPKVELLLKEVGLWDKRNEIVRHLSGGMKRRLMIARALVHDPKLLILDEPTAGVDIEIRRSMWDFLKKTNESGTTIILTTHYLEEAEHLCKNIAILDKGVLIEQSSIKSLLKNLRHQTLVLTTEQPFDKAPDCSDFQVMLLDAHTLEIQVDCQFSLNQIFEILSRQGITVLSMRNKTNRLEELFMDLIRHD
jgi:ABC-2 type transport system ATP-binding protein